MAVFSVRSDVVFSRELLDLWVLQVCGIGTPFREAYEIFDAYSVSISSIFDRRGLPKKFHRRSSALCFASYLKVLTFHNEDLLDSLFTFNTCERKDEEGKTARRYRNGWYCRGCFKVSA